MIPDGISYPLSNVAGSLSPVAEILLVHGQTLLAGAEYGMGEWDNS